MELFNWRVAMTLVIRRCYLIVFVASWMLGVVLIQPVSSAVWNQSGEVHCVIEVVGQNRSGEFVMGAPVCFGSFAESMMYASGGSLRLEGSTSGSIMFADPIVGVEAATFTVGIHFDGPNGTGSSITVTGGNCSGGWWNTSSAWDNRISSSWNGCYRLRHYDSPNKGGSLGSTVGTGSTHNVPWWIDNMAESVSYSSS
jgi:hypothetical protein